MAALRKIKSYKNNGHKRIRVDRRVIYILIGVGILLAIYLGLSIFFLHHFMLGTTINGENFSGKTVEQVEDYVEANVKNYTLTLKEKEGATEKIKGSDINLKYISNDSIQSALDAQKAFAWPKSLFSKKTPLVMIEVEYDETALTEKIKALKCLTQETIESVSAHPEYNGKEFVVVKEVYGTKVDEEVLTKSIVNRITSINETMDLEKAKCYPLPAYLENSKEVKSACQTFNQWLKAEITYDFSSEKITIDQTQLAKFFQVNESMEASFNTEAINEYLKELGKKYNTVGVEQSITTPTGKTVAVAGGTYGWKIDRETESQKLRENIQALAKITREPEYESKAVVRGGAEWGTTYAEVDLELQHMWYIKDGAVVMEADIVSGLPANDRDTPTGIWDILEKKQNKVLTGSLQTDGTPEYETPVEYWMRINWEGIGFHTATWQSSFGGDRYKTKGSHGCINMSLEDSQKLYGIIQFGDPVIVHN